jgi:FkbM family methyltransferase
MKKRVDLIKQYNIDLLLDVGASTGGYGRLIRSIGYNGTIISFEPVKQSFQTLQQYCTNDKRWTAYNYALGDTDGYASINVSGNFDSSSILEMGQSHVANSPHSRIICKEEIEIHKLDSVFNDLKGHSQNILLKIDTQGFEKQVLDGAIKTIPYIRGIQVEMSFEELYKEQVLFDDLKKFIEQLGFTLCLIETGFCSPVTGKLLQSDGIFYRI